MWYELLPSMAIVYACLVIPGVANQVFQKMGNGSKPKRAIRNPYHWELMERDKIVSGNDRHFNAKGLENID